MKGWKERSDGKEERKGGKERRILGKKEMRREKGEKKIRGEIPRGMEEHCLKSYFFQLLVSKCFDIFY